MCLVYICIHYKIVYVNMLVRMRLDVCAFVIVTELGSTNYGVTEYSTDYFPYE